MGRSLAKCFGTYEKSLKKGSRNGKNQPWCSSWGRPWRQDDTRGTSRAQKIQKSRIFGCLREPNMEQKSIKKLSENCIFFCHDLETTFSRSWDDFGSKNLSKIRGLRVTFSTSWRKCEKSVLERPSIGFAIFFKLEASIFRSKIDYFLVFFQGCFLVMHWIDFSSILARFRSQVGGQTGAKIW